MNRRPILATLAIILGVALCWATPPVDQLPSLLTTPAEARNISVIVGGSPPAPAGATLERLGYSERASTSGETSYAWTVNIPVGTTAIVLAAGGYDFYSGNTIVSANLNESQNFTVDATIQGSEASSIGIAHLFSPSTTGSQTVNYTLGSHGYDGYVYIIFYGGAATDALRDSDSASSNTLTLTTVSGDMVVTISVDVEENSFTWTNATAIDATVDGAGVEYQIAQTSADGTSETVSTSSTSGNTIASIVLKPSS